MPTYDTQCEKCELSGVMRLSFADYDLIQSGESSLLCNHCDGACKILFQPSGVAFVMKDGVSGGWMSKAYKENKYRAARRNYMAQREKDNVFVPQLQPNYKGMETGTWKDAQEYARSEVISDHGKKHGEKLSQAVAKTFEPYVSKEKAVKK